MNQGLTYTQIDLYMSIYGIFFNILNVTIVSKSPNL